jgi:putative endonuclease
MYYIYIIYSSAFDKYYVGFSNDPQRRLVEHNNNPFNTYTSKYRPWILKASFKCSETEKEAMRIERLIKKQKSKKLLEKLCDPKFSPTGILAQLVRVPDVRD